MRIPQWSIKPSVTLAKRKVAILVLSVIFAAGCEAGRQQESTVGSAEAPAGSGVEGTIEPSSSTPSSGDQAPDVGAATAGAGGTAKAVVTGLPASVVIASSDLGAGRDRFAFALLDENKALIENADATVEFFRLDGETPESVATLPATFYAGVIEPSGLYVTYPDFTAPGPWGAEISAVVDGAEIATQRVAFEVQADPKAPAVGESPPPTANRTLDDAPIEALSSDPQPDPDFYELTVDEALASHQPTVVVWATPAYCASRICGPVLDEVKSLEAAGWGDRVNFVHIEVYESFDPLELTPLMAEWGLQTEPWVFVFDRNGQVAERLEGNVTATELEPILERVAATEETGGG